TTLSGSGGSVAAPSGGGATLAPGYYRAGLQPATPPADSVTDPAAPVGVERNRPPFGAVADKILDHPCGPSRAVVGALAGLDCPLALA
ncbi:MAG: hypothetical protein V3W34_12170, partial [Phycisphaerae bacterium]